MVLKIEKKENPYKKIRKPIPRPGYVIGDKKNNHRKKRQKEKQVIEKILDNLEEDYTIDDDLYDDF